MVSRAIFQEEQFSARHWENMIGTALLAASIVDAAMRNAGAAETEAANRRVMAKNAAIGV